MTHFSHAKNDKQSVHPQRTQGIYQVKTTVLEWSFSRLGIGRDWAFTPRPMPKVYIEQPWPMPKRPTQKLKNSKTHLGHGQCLNDQTTNLLNNQSPPITTNLPNHQLKNLTTQKLTTTKRIVSQTNSHGQCLNDQTTSVVS